MTAGYLDNVFTFANDSFRQEEPGGKFRVMPRRAHGYGDAASPDTDFQRLLDSDQIISGLRAHAWAAAHDSRLLDPSLTGAGSFFEVHSAGPIGRPSSTRPSFFYNLIRASRSSAFRIMLEQTLVINLNLQRG